MIGRGSQSRDQSVGNHAASRSEVLIEGRKAQQISKRNEFQNEEAARENAGTQRTSFKGQRLVSGRVR